MRKGLLLFVVLLLVLTTFGAVPADQYEDERYGFSDEYGVYVTGEEGERIYLWFWSEWARKWIMGDLTKPYTDVVNMPNWESVSFGKYSLGSAKASAEELSRGSDDPVDPSPGSTEDEGPWYAFCKYLGEPGGWLNMEVEMGTFNSWDECFVLNEDLEEGMCKNTEDAYPEFKGYQFDNKEPYCTTDPYWSGSGS